MFESRTGLGCAHLCAPVVKQSVSTQSRPSTSTLHSTRNSSSKSTNLDYPVCLIYIVIEQSSGWAVRPMSRLNMKTKSWPICLWSKTTNRIHQCVFMLLYLCCSALSTISISFCSICSVRSRSDVRCLLCN